MKKSIKKIKRRKCCHKWTQPQDRREYEGSNGAYDMWDVSYTICEKCAEEKIIRKSYFGKNYV